MVKLVCFWLELAANFSMELVVQLRADAKGVGKMVEIVVVILEVVLWVVMVVAKK